MRAVRELERARRAYKETDPDPEETRRENDINTQRYKRTSKDFLFSFFFRHRNRKRATSKSGFLKFQFIFFEKNAQDETRPVEKKEETFRNQLKTKNCTSSLTVRERACRKVGRSAGRSGGTKTSRFTLGPSAGAILRGLRLCREGRPAAKTSKC